MSHDILTTANIEFVLALLGDLAQWLDVNRRPKIRAFLFREQRLAVFVLFVFGEDLPKDRCQVIPQPAHLVRRIPERLGRFLILGYIFHKFCERELSVFDILST